MPASICSRRSSLDSSVLCSASQFILMVVVFCYRVLVLRRVVGYIAYTILRGFLIMIIV